MPRPRSLPLLITVAADGTATALYTLPTTAVEEEQPLFRFADLAGLLADHGLDENDIEDVRPLAVFPLSALLVDDEVKLHDLIRDMLHDAGYATTTVATLEAARAHLDGAAPTVMLLDLRVAGDTGEELLIELADAPHAPPMVVFSARRDAERITANYGVPTLPKPFELDELLRAVEGAIRDGKRPTLV